jgi:hypothetical protein
MKLYNEIELFNKNALSPIAIEEDESRFQYHGHDILLKIISALNSYILYVRIGDYSPQEIVELMPHLLKANFMLKKPLAGTFSIEPNSNEIGMNFLFHENDVNYSCFYDNLNDIIIATEESEEKINMILQKNHTS